MCKPHKYAWNRAKSPKSDQINRTWGHGQHPHPPRSEISGPDRHFLPLFPRPIAPSFFIDTLQYLFLSVPYYSTLDGLLSIYVMYLHPRTTEKVSPPLLSVSVSEELSAALLRFSDVAAPPRGLSGFIGLCNGPVQPYIPSFGACTDMPGRQQRHLSGSVQPLVPVSDGAAPPRTLPHSHRTRPQSRWASLRVSEFRGGLHDFLQPFTPPLLACQPPSSAKRHQS